MLVGLKVRSDEALTKLAALGSSRKGWWLALAFFLASWPIAAALYASGLSRWLQRPSLPATLGAATVILAACALFIFVSMLRARDCGAKPKQLLSVLLLLPVPFWLIVLGLLPSASGFGPSPYETLVRQLKTGTLVALLVVVVGLAFYIGSGITIRPNLNVTSHLPQSLFGSSGERPVAVVDETHSGDTEIQGAAGRGQTGAVGGEADATTRTGAAGTQTRQIGSPSAPGGSSTPVASAPRSTEGRACYTGRRGGTYTITASGNRNYSGC